jgi:hypothetical protein
MQLHTIGIDLGKAVFHLVGLNHRAIAIGAAFKKGRGFSAWLGIVPGEYTTGGKQKAAGD